MTKDRSTGIVATVLGAIIAVSTSQLPKSMIEGDIGPAVFPYFCAGLLMLCGIGLLVTGSKEQPGIFNKESLKRLALIFVIVLIYCAVMTYLGFFLPTLAVLFVMCTMFAEDIQCPWWHRLIFAVALTVAIYLLFHNVLNLKLPVNQLF